MEFKFSDSKVFTEKEKKFYTTTGGIRLDLTWKPSIIDKLYKEHAEILQSVRSGYAGHLEALEKVRANKGTESDTAIITKFAEIVDSYKDKTYSIIIAACKANGFEITSDWIDENLLMEEKELIIQIIMDIHQDSFNLKKK